MPGLVDVLEESRQLGFLGPGPVEAHIVHAEGFAAAVAAAPSLALDLGAGGGVPGLVLAAITWPETQWTLLDSQLRRTTFLTEAVEALGLEFRVQVVTERAEVIGRDLEHRGRYDLVTSRSFGPPAVTVECSAPLLGVGGYLVVSEPPASDDSPGSTSARWPTAGIAAVGFGPPRVDTHDSATYAVLTMDSPCPDKFPRRVGIPAKRPLY